VGYWKDDLTLWTRGTAAVPYSARAHFNLGVALYKRGRLDAAISNYSQAVKIDPDGRHQHYNLAVALEDKGRWHEAVVEYKEELRIVPDEAQAHSNLGRLLMTREGKVDEAMSHFRHAIQAAPSFADAHLNLGLALAAKGQLPEAEAEFREALEANPKLPSANWNLARALMAQRETPEAVNHLRAELGLKWNNQVANDLAWMLATSPDPSVRNGAEAVQLAERICSRTHYRIPTALDTLAAAYARAGRFGEAAATARKAIPLASPGQKREFEARLRLYEARRPYESAR
jgi:tetratricopeptide (TPR) repeat protein